MIFSILWKHTRLAIYELEKVVWAQNLNLFNKNVCFFEIERKYEEKLKKLAWQIKIWIVYSKSEFLKEEFLIKLFKNKKLVGSNDKELLLYLKTRWFVRRFKVLQDIKKSDIEVKNKWVEIIRFSENLYGIVEWWQPIQIYEKIDFEKPVRSMKIWMMPAKLTHYLINISTILEKNKVIYDPFCWLGTTLFVANWLGYDVFGSDINASPAKQNFKWWQKVSFYNANEKVYIFKQDITKLDISKKKFLHSVTNVVSEWFLWPVINRFLNLKEAQKLEDEVWQIYFKAVDNLLRLPNLENIVFTFPVYFLKSGMEYKFDKIYNALQKLGVRIEILPEIYKRQWQKVWRQIVKIFK